MAVIVVVAADVIFALGIATTIVLILVLAEELAFESDLTVAFTKLKSWLAIFLLLLKIA